MLELALRLRPFRALALAARARPLRTLALALVLAAAACRSTDERAGPTPAASAAPADMPTARVAWSHAGSSLEGRSIRYVVLGEGPTTVLVLATIHGDEDAGTPLCLDLAEHLAADPALLAGRRVVIVPELNPDGRAARRRHNARGVDLNRNFPASNRSARSTSGAAPGSEPETRALLRLLERWQPERVVSLHQPLACVDFDGPAEALARALAQTGPLRLRRLGSRPGSLGSWLGVDAAIAVITLELAPGDERLTDAALWERYGALLLAAVRWPDRAP